MTTKCALAGFSSHTILTGMGQPLSMVCRICAKLMGARIGSATCRCRRFSACVRDAGWLQPAELGSPLQRGRTCDANCACVRLLLGARYLWRLTVTAAQH